MINDRKKTTSPTFGLGIFNRPHARYIEIHVKYYGVVGKAPVPSRDLGRAARPAQRFTVSSTARYVAETSGLVPRVPQPRNVR